MIKLNVRKSLNKAFLKVKPNRTEIEEFKTNLIQLIDRTNDTESEEFHKNLVSDFLKKTYYEPDYFINTKGRNDLVIHTGKSAKTPVGVIVEAKKPTNKAEMLSNVNINTKAFQELVLYFLRERITHKNLEIKNLIASNINEWFVFDANLFEKKFAQNKKLVKQFEDFEGGRLAGKSTDFFYKEIAQPFIESIKEEIEFTYFDLRDYEKPLRNDDPKDDNKLIALFKVLSPEHLLKLPFVNDSNSLDKKFYSELLHIIGLTETKEGGKKVIQRKKSGERNQGALLENAIDQLDTLDKVNRLPKPSQYGETSEERLFNVGLELSITWVNRILFLKLLEAQLVTYHKGDPKYTFLNSKKITDYDKLNSLFFQVLAKRTENRNEEALKEFSYVPYLNSSLFEPNEMEHTTILISNLRDEKKLPILSNTVLKDTNGKKRTGEINALEYFFEFLDAYDFSSEGGEDIQEDNKALINASVLGLIFEKINGYKDGSFFTPGFITMYMCRETIRRSVVQKFNETKGWDCTDLDQLYNKIDDPKEANEIVNSLKICDPAVGSGHFLVSALNEMIAIKNDLKILQDREGRRLKEYHFEVVNDELIVTDEDGEFFEYSPTNKESQRIQETLFHEKQTIIENCLFGVDINPNSVKICRLRLWIELLKNAYYKAENELETLPNIDINIKCGNSLISRFDLDADIKEALKKSKWSIDSYKVAVNSYRNAQSKEEKHEMERLINDIKSDFRSEISKNDPKIKRLYKMSGELAVLTTQTSLFDMAAKEKKEWKKKVEKLTTDTQKLEAEIEEIKNNKIYENAFEWRFEFPEVLNEQGDFIGFDTVIGNPPYLLVQSMGEKSVFDFYRSKYVTASYKIDTYPLFYELAYLLGSNSAHIAYITPNTFLKNKYSKELRCILLKQQIIEVTNFFIPVFEDASVDTLIFIGLKEHPESTFSFRDFGKQYASIYDCPTKDIDQSIYYNEGSLEMNLDLDDSIIQLLSKVDSKAKHLKQVGRAYFGIQTFDRSKHVSNIKIDESYQPVIDGGNVKRYWVSGNSEFVNFRKENIKSGGDASVYDRKRIVVRQIGIYPEGAIVSSGLYTLNTIYNIFLYEDDSSLLDSILGLLNSRLLRFYWFKKYYDRKATFPKIKKEPLESLPLIFEQGELIDDVKFQVNQILSLKKSDPNTDTSQLEAEIDQMVYELYGLTEEEIAIVEEAVK